MIILYYCKPCFKTHTKFWSNFYTLNCGFSIFEFWKNHLNLRFARWSCLFFSVQIEVEMTNSQNVPITVM